MQPRRSNPAEHTLTATLSLFIWLLTLTGCGDRLSIPVWRWTLESRCYAQPLVEENTVYVVSQAGEIIAGDIQTGAKTWQLRVEGSILTDPVIHGNAIIVATENGNICAVDKRKGFQLWKTKVQQDGFIAPLSADRDLLLAPSQTGILYALSARTGAVLWKLPGNVKYNARAVLNEPHIFLGGWSRDFLCLRWDGSINWRYHASDIIVDDALLHKNTVFFTAYDHFVYAMNAESGNLLWRFPSTQPLGLLLEGDTLYFASGQELVALNPDSGLPIRKFSAGIRISRTYAWKNHILLVGPQGKVYDLNPDSGTVRLFIHTQSPVFKIAFSQDKMIISDQTYSVLAFQIPGPQ